MKEIAGLPRSDVIAGDFDQECRGAVLEKGQIDPHRSVGHSPSRQVLSTPLNTHDGVSRSPHERMSSATSTSGPVIFILGRSWAKGLKCGCRPLTAGDLEGLT